MVSDFFLVLCRFRDLKECDGTHSERSARKVPTLRNQRKHRTEQGDLWDIYGLSVAFVYIIFTLKNQYNRFFFICAIVC